MTKSTGKYERHGMSKTSAYSIWSSMHARCKNFNSPAFSNYGGRGIAVCDRWKSFSAFYADMGEPPAGMTLERINNDFGYSPENCQWSTRTDQGRNKRNNIIIEIDGVSKPLSSWVEQEGAVSYATAHARLAKGWAPNEAVFTPIVTDRRGIQRGRSIAKSAPKFDADLAERNGVSTATVFKRLRRGWRLEDAVSLPPRRGRRAKHGVKFKDDAEVA